MPKDDINYSFTEGGVVYDFYDVFVPAEYFREPSLFVWGNNYFALGNNTATSRITPVTTFSGGTNWKTLPVTMGGLVDTYATSSAIKTDGTLWIWGSNAYGNLGINNNTTVYRCTPITTFAGGNNWKQVSMGEFFTAAIKTDGTLWAWGRNLEGQLGINDTTNKSTPVTTFAGGNNWKQVDCTRFSTLAIKTDGTLWTWGINNSGQLGINNTTNKSTPVTTFAGGNNWKQVACGYRHAAAIKTDGTLWTWGYNSYGSLGVNTTSSEILTPVTTFAGGNNWKFVAAGHHNTGAIKTDGTLWMWGGDFTAQSSAVFGINAHGADRLTPVTTFAGGNNWKQVTMGNTDAAAIKTDGTLWVWGENGQGALGVNDNSMRCTPVTTFAGGNEWKVVSSGSRRFNNGSTFAIKYIPDP